MPDFITIDEINGQVTNSESNIVNNLSLIQKNLNTINSSLKTVSNNVIRGAVKSVQRGIVQWNSGDHWSPSDDVTNITISSINPSKSFVSLYTAMKHISNSNIGSNRAQVGTGIYVEDLKATQLTVNRTPATVYGGSYYGTSYVYPAFSWEVVEYY